MDSDILGGNFGQSSLIIPWFLAQRREKEDGVIQRMRRRNKKNNSTNKEPQQEQQELVVTERSNNSQDDADFVVLVILANLVSELSVLAGDTTTRRHLDPCPLPRVGFYVRDRLDWPWLVNSLLEEGKGDYWFSKKFRMPYASFSKLCDLLRASLQADEAMSFRRTKKPPISPEIILYCLLRWLSGGEYHDLRIKAGICVPSFYRVLHLAVQAVLDCEDLAYKFPSTMGELQDAADAFASLSTQEALCGCVACVDGYLFSIATPSSKETGNVKSFYSGHYNKYGIIVQAACDASLRFVYVGVAAPGGTNDITAFRKTQLSEMVQRLPLGKYIIGDAAYVCTETLLTPFSGAARHLPGHDDYNFYCSQLRIRIEQAFGLMTVKWRILRSPMQLKLKNVGNVFMCITRLHNFCINERLRRTGDILLDSRYVRNIPTTDAEGEPLFHPTEPPGNNDTTTTAIPGNSAIRDMIVQHLQEKGLQRPEY